MPAINDFLKQHPELADKDPERIAAYVFDTQIKHSGKSKERFEEYFLGAPVKSSTLLGEEYNDSGLTKGVKSLARGAVDMFQGDAEFQDMGNTNDAGITGEGVAGKAKIGAAGVFGSDDDIKNAIAREYPDASFEKDENGNEYVTLADGRKGYVNLPGADAEDATRLIGKTLSFLGAGAAGALAKGGVALRAGLVGGASGGTDAAMQKLAGRDEIDMGQVGATAALGAGAEAVAPVMGRVTKAMMQRLKGGDPLRVGKALARDAGLDFTDDQARRLGAAYLVPRNVDDAAAAGKAEFNMPYTKGQQLPKGTKQEKIKRFEQMTTEEGLFQNARKGQNLRSIRDNQITRTQDIVGEIADEFSASESAGKLPQDAGERLQRSVVRQHDKELKSIEKAYGRVGDLEITPDGVSSIQDRVMKALDEKKVFRNKKLTPATRQLAEDIAEFDESTIEGLHAQRQVIDEYYDAAKNKRDEKGVLLIREEYNKAFSDATENHLLSGDPKAFKRLRKADRLFKDYAKKFRDKDFADGVVKKMIDKKLTAEEVATYMVGMSGYTKTGGARIAKEFKRVVGKDSEAWDSLREMALLSVLKKDGEAITQKSLTNNINRALDGKGSSLFKELYTESERAKLRRFGDAVNATLKDKDFVATSGTAERAFRRLDAYFGDVPAFKMLPAVVESYMARQAVKVPERLSRPLSLAAPANAGYTSQ